MRYDIKFNSVPKETQQCKTIDECAKVLLKYVDNATLEEVREICIYSYGELSPMRVYCHYSTIATAYKTGYSDCKTKVDCALFDIIKNI